MNSLTMIAHGVASGRRHGRSRACSAYQLKTRPTTDCALRTGICRSCTPTDTSVTLPCSIAPLAALAPRGSRFVAIRV
jgi:hypothetical protein